MSFDCCFFIVTDTTKFQVQACMRIYGTCIILIGRYIWWYIFVYICETIGIGRYDDTFLSICEMIWMDGWQRVYKVKREHWRFGKLNSNINYYLSKRQYQPFVREEWYAAFVIYIPMVNNSRLPLPPSQIISHSKSSQVWSNLYNKIITFMIITKSLFGWAVAVSCGKTDVGCQLWEKLKVVWLKQLWTCCCEL